MSADPTTLPTALMIDPQRLRVALDRKPEHLRGDAHEITAEVTLEAAEWVSLVNDPMRSRAWLADANAVSGGNATVLVHGPEGGLILIRTEGADYARYAARIA